MKIMVVIPMKPYRVWMARCESARMECLWLKNGIIVQNGDGLQEVQILCDAERAHAIVHFASRTCPDVVPYIKQIANPY